MGEYRTLKQAAEQNNISIDKIKNYIRKIKNSNKQDEIELYKEYLEIATENQQQAKIKGGQNGKRTTTYSIEQINSWYSMIVEGDMTLDEVEKETGISKSVIHENLNNNLSDLQRKQLEIIYEKHKRNATKNYQNDLEFFLENGTNVVGFTKKSRR